MVSMKQMEANRNNAKLGGVKTETGKTISCKNAITHGILSKEILLPGENERELTQLRHNIMAEKAPEGEIETFLADRLVTCIWKLRRIACVETKLNDKGCASPTVVHRGDFISRYETTVDRLFTKTLHELERLQLSRQGKNILPPLTIDIELPEPQLTAPEVTATPLLEAAPQQ